MSTIATPFEVTAEGGGSPVDPSPQETKKALLAKVMRAEKQVEAAVGRAERAEAGRDAERARAEALRSTNYGAMAGRP